MASLPPPPTIASPLASQPSSASSSDIPRPAQYPPAAYATARIVGPGLAGLGEIALFHPIDTIAKRLMSHQGAVVPAHTPLRGVLSGLNRIIFREAATGPLSGKLAALYPGLSFAVSYKIAQRIYKFGGQPFVRDVLHASPVTPWLERQLGSRRRAAIATEALAGSVMGAGEVMLLPLDILKIKAQTNPAVLQSRGMLALLIQERAHLFQGAGWTLARNLPGSLALFGGSAAVKEYVFAAGERPATLAETLVAAAAGSVLSLLVSSPLDVVKTRVQNKGFSSTVTGSQIVRDILRTEGVTAFARGITPKLLTVGPKLICSFTAAQYLTGRVLSLFPSSPEAGNANSSQR